MNEIDNNGDTSLHIVARTPHTRPGIIFVDLLFDYDNYYHEVSWHNYKECIKILLGSGADVNASNNDGKTPLYELIIVRGYKFIEKWIEMYEIPIKEPGIH